MQRSELQPRLHHGLAYAYVRPDPGRHLGLRHGGEEHEKREINVGDVVHIKAGERHWHGAKRDTTMGHITITLVGSQAAHG
jgi:hypothetical protein